MQTSLHFSQKQSLNLSLKLWLPILQAPLEALDTLFKDHEKKNPFLENRGRSLNYRSSSGLGDSMQKSAFIENTLAYDRSFYEQVEDMIAAPLFPTPRSQEVAHAILEDINEEGYFDGDITSIAQKCCVTNEFVESVRQRFAQLEPAGIGALDFQESCRFQLSNVELDDELYAFTTKLIDNFKHMDRYHKHHLFEKATAIIKKFNIPPVVEYLEEGPVIVPDFFVEIGDDIVLKINNDYYPDVVVNDPFSEKNDELRQKLKEARDLVNLLELRKSTLYKLVLVIVEKQISFFVGSELKPLTMKMVAEELGFEESTISRAVSNKYITCERGTFALKSFFTNAVSKNLSSSEIKNFIVSLVENESKETPLTDQDILDQIENKFQLKMVRRTITKYRKLLDIPSSKERKKMYRINL